MVCPKIAQVLTTSSDARQGMMKSQKKIKNPGLYFVQQMTFDLGTGGLVISWILGGSKDKIRS